MPLRDKSERALPLTRLPKWIKIQESMIGRARSVADKANAAGDLAKCLEALQLAMRMQSELIALAAPKRTAAKSEAEPEPDAEDSNAPITPRPPPVDLSKLSDEEIARLAGAEPFVPNGEVASSTSPVAAERKPPSRPVGRPKGYEASGAAKEAKARADLRRANEEREREARGNQMRGYDAANTWPLSTLPEEWRDD